MGRTISIYIDDDLVDKIKEKKLSLSKAVREALKDWLDKEPAAEVYDFLEKSLYKKITKEGEKAWKELREERDRW